MVFMGPQKEKPERKPVPIGGKPVRHKNGNAKKHREMSEMQEKQNLLDQLTRQAEVNTKILERERALVLGMEIHNVETQSIHAGSAGKGLRDNNTPMYGNNAYGGAPPFNEMTVVRPGRDPRFANGPNQAVPSSYRPPAQQRQPGPMAQRQQRQQAPAQNRIVRAHNFLNAAPTKLFDPRQVPGLGGGGGPIQEPASPFAGHEDGTASPGPNGTFPDSPSFYPGMVFAIPMGQGAETPTRNGQEQPPPPPPQQPQGAGARNTPPGAFGWQQQQQRGQSPRQAAGSPGSQQQGQQLGMGGRGRQTPPQQQGPGYGPQGMRGGQGQQGGPSSRGGPGSSSPPPAFEDPRAAAEARKRAYREELEDQIRQKQQLKAQERDAQRRQDMQAEARALAAPPPWDAAARMQRRGGGGEPLRDVDGQQMADLRGMRNRGGAVSPQGGENGMGWVGPAGMMGAPPPPPGQGPPFPTRRGPMPNLTVQVPNGGAYPGQRSPQEDQLPNGPTFGGPGGPMVMPIGGRPGPYGGQPQPQGPPPYGWQQAPPNAASFGFQPMRGGGSPTSNGWMPAPRISNGGSAPDGMAGSPGGGQNSPGGARRFLGAMNELRAGPSDDQRRHMENQRAQLQRDLEEQIRQKRERKAKEKADEEAARQREEAELNAYYDRLNAQKEEEKRAHREQLKEIEAQAQAPGVAAVAGPDGPAYVVPGPGGKPRRLPKKLIDADWLGPPQPQQNGSVGGAGQLDPSIASIPPGARFGRRSAHETDGAPVNVRGSQQAWMHPASNSPRAGDGGVNDLLTQLQHEQAQLRDDLMRQQQLMEKLSHDNHSAVSDRDRARKELERVRGVLAGRPGPLDISDLGATSSDALDQFVVSTHLVPRDVNNIPTRLPTPIEAPWAAVREPLLLHKPQPGRGAFSFDDDGVDSLEQMMHEGQGYVRNSRSAGPSNGGNANEYNYFSNNDGMYRPLSRVPGPPSRLPRAPGLHGPPPPQHMAYGGGGGGAGPGRSRYSSFFNLEDGMAGMGMGMGNGPAAPLRQEPPAVPLVAFGRRAAPAAAAAARPPPSPAILRADMLPSPDRKSRMHVAAQPNVARGRGRGTDGGAAPPAAGPAAGLAGIRRARPQRQAMPKPVYDGGGVDMGRAMTPPQLPDMPELGPRPVAINPFNSFANHGGDGDNAEMAPPRSTPPPPGSAQSNLEGQPRARLSAGAPRGASSPLGGRAASAQSAGLGPYDRGFKEDEE